MGYNGLSSNPYNLIWRMPKTLKIRGRKYTKSDQVVRWWSSLAAVYSHSKGSAMVTASGRVQLDGDPEWFFIGHDPATHEQIIGADLDHNHRSRMNDCIDYHEKAEAEERLEAA
jgi:hypothetical protein